MLYVEVSSRLKSSEMSTTSKSYKAIDYPSRNVLQLRRTSNLVTWSSPVQLIIPRRVLKLFVTQNWTCITQCVSMKILELGQGWLHVRIKFSWRSGDKLKLWFVTDQNWRDGDKLGSTHRHLFMFCGRIVIFLECGLGSTENCDSFTHYNNRIKFSWRGLGMTEDTLILI